MDDDEAEALDSDENGWKIIHTDVFRFPPHKNLFCAILGNVFKCYSSCSGKKITYSPGYIGNLDLANVLAKH